MEDDFTFDQFIYVDCGEERYQDVTFTSIKIVGIGGILDKIFRTTKKTNWSIKIYLKLNNKVKIGNSREDNYDYSNDLQLLNEVIEAFKKEKGIIIELYINDEWNVEDVYNIDYTNKSTLMLLYGHGIQNSPKIIIGTGSTIDDNFDVNTFLTKKTDGKLIAGFATCYSKDIMRSEDLIPKKICYVSLDSENDTCSNQTHMFDSMIELIMYHSGKTSSLFPTSIGIQFNNHSENNDPHHVFQAYDPRPPEPLSNWDDVEDYYYSDYSADEDIDEDEENHEGGSYKKKTKKRKSNKKRSKKRKSNKKRSNKRKSNKAKKSYKRR